MGYRSKPRLNLIWDWSRTVGDMIKSDDGLGASVVVCCATCKTHKEVDLHKIAYTRGPFYTLWERYPHCPDCGGRMVFLASHIEGNRRVPLKTDQGMSHGVVSELQEACPWCGVLPRTGLPPRRN